MTISLNLRFGLADDKEHSWDLRKERHHEFFEKYRPDFIVFQEANTFQAEFLKEIYKDYGCIGVREPAPEYWQHLLIFFKKDYLLIKEDRFFLSVTPDIPSRQPGSKWPRQCTIGTFDVHGKMLIVVNTHFDFTSPVQEKSAQIILGRLKEGYEGHPVILMGDFNANMESPCHDAFTGGRGGFKSAFKKPGQGTFHGFTGRATGDQIDWIMHRGGLTLEESLVIEESCSGGCLSDHFPILARFRFQ